ncbi:MAG TPA: hypothetical protein VHO50_00765 [Bacteroidales bacterium]|nr:hypothetical protein [Bacteroidales bacterium]
MKKILAVFLLTLFVLSCEKDKSNRDLAIENMYVPLISKVLIDGETFIEYSYNESNLLTEEKSRYHYTKHTYDNINRLVTSDFYMDIRLASSNYSVLQDAMNRTEWVNPENTARMILHLLKYNTLKNTVSVSLIRPDGSKDSTEYLYEDGRIVKRTGYYNGSVSNYIDYYYDDKGNVLKETRYNVSLSGDAELSTTTEYEYDNMNNPYRSFKRLLTPGIFTNPNNIIKETYTIYFDIDPSVDKVSVKRYSYEYNNAGYPVSVNGSTVYVYK